MQNNWIKTIIMLILFVVFLTMVIVGRDGETLKGLGIQLVGLAGLIGLLFVYNSKYK